MILIRRFVQGLPAALLSMNGSFELHANLPQCFAKEAPNPAAHVCRKGGFQAVVRVWSGELPLFSLNVTSV